MLISTVVEDNVMSNKLMTDNERCPNFHRASYRNTVLHYRCGTSCQIRDGKWRYSISYKCLLRQLAYNQYRSQIFARLTLREIKKLRGQVAKVKDHSRIFAEAVLTRITDNDSGSAPRPKDAWAKLVKIKRLAVNFLNKA